MTTLTSLIEGIKTGQIVPYLGPEVLAGVSNKETGKPLPVDSDSLIIALNHGKPMHPRLMYEFPRAAMDVELKRGRSAVARFFEDLYVKQQWTRAPLHDWLAKVKPHYVIDINRDLQLQHSYADTPHQLICGIARLGGTDYRFKLYHYDGQQYYPSVALDPQLPMLFKPMGTPLPEAHYIASDADYVDYITELMGGFAIPAAIKEYRKGKQYVFLGLRLTRDTERMILSDVIYAAGEPAGWALIPDATEKEKRFCQKMNIEVIAAGVNDLLTATPE